MNGGTLIRVIPKTLFDFGYLPGGTTDGVIVAKALNVIPYSSAHLWSASIRGVLIPEHRRRSL